MKKNILKKSLFASFKAQINSSSFSCTAIESRFWVFWMRKTIKKVMIVVPVFITSCQVSLKPKIGPNEAQIIMTRTAAMNVTGFPVIDEVFLANLVNSD